MFLLPTSDVEARTYTLFGGAAKVTLPKGASLEDFNLGSSKGYQVVFSKNDLSNRAYITRKSVSRSLTDSKWGSGVVKYYNDLFKRERGYRKNLLKHTGKQVKVDYQYRESAMQSRDYTKYIRANSTTEVQAYYYTLKLTTWNTAKARQLRVVVDSLRPGR